MRSFVPFCSFLGGSFLGGSVLAAFAACTTESEPPPGPVFEGGDGGAPPCASCLERPCLGPWAICLTDETCQVMHACAAHGDASACVCGPGATASDAGADPRALHRAFAACNAAHAGACAPRCTSASSAVPTCGADAGAPSVDACTACVDGACGDPERACGVGTECAAFLACAYDAADATAAQECGRLYATGKAAVLELATCTHVECNQPCGL